MNAVSWQRRAAAILALPMTAAAAVAVAIVLYRNTGALLVGLVSVALLVIAVWWAATEQGVRRVVVPVLGIVGSALLVVATYMAFDGPGRVWRRTAIILLILIATFWLIRFALTRPPPAVVRSPSPSRPVLLCNPWSGGGKVEKFGLVEVAEELGVETVMLAEGLDLEELTRDAVARGADCLGMAGGDGSQALVASVAIEHGLPFVCIPAGTRNHFALDLGLDRDDPRAAMAAFRDAIERRVDYATVNGRLFVNNVSLGIYATIVQSDDYRDNKVEVSRSVASDLLGRQAEPFDLQYTTPDGDEVDGAFVIMVSNNPYVLGPRRDVAQRRHLDTGRLGVFAISSRTGAHAARLVTLGALGLRHISPDWDEFTTDVFEVTSRSGTAFMGVDGEALEAATPLRFESHPSGLSMFVPEGNLDEVERRRARDASLADVVSIAAGRERS